MVQLLITISGIVTEISAVRVSSNKNRPYRFIKITSPDKTYKIVCFGEDLSKIGSLNIGQFVEVSSIYLQDYQGEERGYFTSTTEVDIVIQPDISNKLHYWNNLLFYSYSEIKIAEAFEKKGVFFIPNPKGRLGPPSERVNRMPDFLVLFRGVLGILEVDGDSSHPPSRTVHDHERDRLFKREKIHIIEHYDARKCFETPDLVVEEFLTLMANF